MGVLEFFEDKAFASPHTVANATGHDVEAIANLLERLHRRRFLEWDPNETKGTARPSRSSSPSETIAHIYRSVSTPSIRSGTGTTRWSWSTTARRTGGVDGAFSPAERGRGTRVRPGGVAGRTARYWFLSKSQCRSGEPRRDRRYRCRLPATSRVAGRSRPDTRRRTNPACRRDAGRRLRGR